MSQYDHEILQKTTTSILNFHYQVITCTIERALLKTPVIGQTAYDYVFIWHFFIVFHICVLFLADCNRFVFRPISKQETNHFIL